jgi:DNA-binding PadR family transcriptional regulator
MSARHALLGLLLDRPGYPYELGERLQRRLGPAWRVNSGQLYQDVEWLRKKGLIGRVDDQPSREGRHVYAITDNGIDAFEEWLDEVGDGPRPTRRPLLAKVTLAGPARIRRTLEQIDAYQRDRAELLADLLRQEAAIATDETPLRADHVLLRLNLSADIYALQGELRWARRARDVILSLLEHDEVVWPSMAPGPLAGAQASASGKARRDLFARMSSKRLLPGCDDVNAQQGDAAGTSAHESPENYRDARSSR